MPNSSDVRSLHTAQCLESLRDAGPATTAQLSTRLSLSRPTIDAILRDQVVAGRVAEVDTRRHDGAGRPARCFRFRDESGLVLGLDVGPHRVRAVLATLAGTIVASHVRASGDTPMETARELVHRLGERERVADALVGICAGVPGMVDDRARVTSTSLPHWVGRDLGEYLSLRGMRARVENDVNLAVVGEQWIGAARGIEDVVHLHLGRRSSGAVMLGGRLRRGHNFAAGELGHLKAVAWPSLENLEGGPEGFFRRLHEAEHGDPQATAWLEQVSDQVARGVAGMVFAIDPQMVTIGGGASTSALLLQQVERAVGALLLPSMHVPIVASRLGGAATVAGALGVALDHAWMSMFPLSPPPRLPRPSRPDTFIDQFRPLMTPEKTP